MTEYFGDDARSMRARRESGDYYLGGDPENVALQRQNWQLAEQYRLEFINGDREKAHAILRSFLGSVGEDVVVVPPVYIDYGRHVHLADRVEVNMGVTFLDVVDIFIGQRSLIGPNVQFLTPLHPMAPAPRRAGVEWGRPITIGENVWIGGGAIICPGVVVGDNSVIGAGSVVTRNIPPNSLAVGNPARVIREITETELPPQSE